MTGMKEGAGEDPFADDAGDTPDEDDPALDDSTSDSEETVTEIDTQQSFELPYIHRREGVKDGRTQLPMWLQEDTDSDVDDRVEELEDVFGERVYRTDYVEAALRAEIDGVGVETVLRRWGYGLR